MPPVSGALTRLDGPLTWHIGASRTVAAYCARHTKQESHMLDEKSEEELEKTKSVRSVSGFWVPCVRLTHRRRVDADCSLMLARVAAQLGP